MLSPHRYIPLLILSFILTDALATLNKQLTLTIDLEMQHPRLTSKPSSRGFPANVHLFERQLPSELSKTSSTHSHDHIFTSRTVTVDLLGGITKVGEYYTRIEIGGQRIRVQIDTGSSTLAFPVAECEHCLPSDQRYNPRLSKTGKQRWISCLNDLCERDMCSEHQCTKCSSKDACCAEEDPVACGFTLRYGDGSGARGGLMVDEMKWGNISTPVIFGAILYDTDDFERKLVDGIFGMAYEFLACNPTCVEPPFQQMVKAGVIADEFSICMTAQGGKLVLGSFDHSMTTANISYVPLALSTPPTFYTMNVSSGVTVGSRTLLIPGVTAGILDSGTTLIVVSEVFFEMLLKHLLEFYCNVPGLCKTKMPWFRPSACVALTEEEVDRLPDLTFNLGGLPDGGKTFPLVMQAQDYMLRYKKSNKEYRCVGIMAMKKMQPGTDIIFGNTIMQKYVTHYDRKNKRLGFAEMNTQCGQSTQCNSYTQCEECAGAHGCSFDFVKLVCSESRSGSGIIPYPQCEGDSCYCSLGPRTGLVFGVAAGGLGALLVLALIAFVAGIYNQRRRPGSNDFDQRAQHVPLYSLGDDEDADGDGDGDQLPGHVQSARKYLPVPTNT